MKHECDLLNAPKFADWIKNRGGVAVWKSVNLSNPGAGWSTPAMTDGNPTPKPTWQADDSPEIVTDPLQIRVYRATVLEHIPVRLKASQGMAVLTDASQRKVDKALAKYKTQGKNVFWRRNGDMFIDPGMDICEDKDVGTLKQWMEETP